jgi:antitoxin Phd
MKQEAHMGIWPVQDAKARFSEFLDTCLEDGPQIVSRRGAEAAVLVPIGQWRKLQAAGQPSLKDLLLSDTARADLDIPSRGNRRRRVPEALG